jgi:hypothetical protein
MKRETGYYWVKSNSGWHVAHFDGKHFADGIGLHHIKDGRLLEINETRILSPDELAVKAQEYSEAYDKTFGNCVTLDLPEHMKPKNFGKISFEPTPIVPIKGATWGPSDSRQR